MNRYTPWSTTLVGPQYFIHNNGEVSVLLAQEILVENDQDGLRISENLPNGTNIFYPRPKVGLSYIRHLDKCYLNQAEPDFYFDFIAEIVFCRFLAAEADIRTTKTNRLDNKIIKAALAVEPNLHSRIYDRTQTQLWLLKCKRRTAFVDRRYQGNFSKMNSAVICAETAQRARELAQAIHGDEGTSFHDVWLNPRLTDCWPLPAQGKEAVVCHQLFPIPNKED